MALTEADLVVLAAVKALADLHGAISVAGLRRARPRLGSPGRLAGSLARLEDAGLVESGHVARTKGGRAVARSGPKSYWLTARGEAVL